MANTDKIFIKKLDESYIHITGNKSILLEILDRYTFEVEGAKWSPRVVNGYWDGKIRLFKENKLYFGLVFDLIKWLKQENYPFETDFEIELGSTNTDDLSNFIKEIKVPKKFQERYYQIDGILKSINNKRTVILSPTASGKSYMLYILYRWFRKSNKKVLICVPRKGLGAQLYSDFVEYNNDQDIHNTVLLKAGVDKNQYMDLCISTWQSIYNQPQEWFEQFDVVIMDEVHEGKAKEVSKIPEKSINAEWKIGFTGTLDDIKINKLVLEGLFGPIKRVATTRELIDAGFINDLIIKVLILKYPIKQKKELRSLINKPENKKNKIKHFSLETSFINANKERHYFIKNLAEALPGNTLVLFHFIENHGDFLHEVLKNTNIPYNYIHGNTNTDIERIRKEINGYDKSITLASDGVFSTGTNIPNIHNLILTMGGKAKIKLLQSIGRTLRLSENGTKSKIFDIGDDLRTGKLPNYSLKHLSKRVEIYNREEFDYEIINHHL